MSLAPGSPTYGLLEQYAVASSKLELSRLSRFLACFSQHIAVLEEALKMYQRNSPALYQHQLAVVEAILSSCLPRVNPIKHARALIEKAKLVRFIPHSKWVSLQSTFKFRSPLPLPLSLSL